MKEEPPQSMRKGWLVINQKAFSLVEVLLAGAIFSLLVTALVGAYLYGQESTALAGNRARAVLLAEEGLEAIRNIRDAGFVNLTDGTFGLTTSSNRWNLSGSSDTSSIFTRQLAIGSIDVKRKIVTSTVTWQQNLQRTGLVSLVSRLTNWIASAGIGNWASPIQEATLDFSGINDGLKIQAQGDYVYIVRNDGTPDFLIVDVSIPASPVLVSSLSLTGIPTNIAVSGNFAYVSSQDDSQELQIINISAPIAPVVAGTFNATGNEDALGVYAVGTTVYLVRTSGADNEFVIINAAVPAAPASVGTLDLGATGYEVWVTSTKAYVASGSNSSELQVVDITAPATPVIFGTGLDISGNTDAITIAGTGNTVLLGRSANIYLINVSNPASPSQISLYNGAGTVDDIALNFGHSNTYVYFVTANSNKEFEVFDISVPATPVSVGSLNLLAFNGIAYDSTLDRAFIVGPNDAAELTVIAPQ